LKTKHLHVKLCRCFFCSKVEPLIDLFGYQQSKKEVGTFGPTSFQKEKYLSYTRFSLIRAFLPVRERK